MMKRYMVKYEATIDGNNYTGWTMIQAADEDKAREKFFREVDGEKIKYVCHVREM